MFLGCIKFIFQVKNGPFAEHSNQLWNISGVQTWSKVNSGLIKMYKAEVNATYCNLDIKDDELILLFDSFQQVLAKYPVM